MLWALAAVTVTLADWLMAVALIVAEIVLVSATVEDRDQMACPLPLVVAVRLAGVVLLPVPEMASVTVAPAITLFAPSLAVTVMVEVLDPVLAGIVAGEAETVELVADTVPAVTVTVAV